MTKTAACVLCLKMGELRASHFLPKSLYKLCRSSSAKNPNPITLDESHAISSSRQAVRRLLCGACEQLLSSSGERYIVGKCFRGNGSFPLRELMLLSTPHHILGGDPFYYGSRIKDINIHCVRYFAASVFWRASVARWHVPHSGTVRNPLGARYQEDFRKCLTGHGGFPLNARLLLWVADEEDPPQMFSFPDATTEAGFHAHRFYIPGLEFLLLIGSKLPTEIHTVYRKDHSEVPIFFCRAREGNLYRSFVMDLRKRANEMRDLISIK